VITGTPVFAQETATSEGTLEEVIVTAERREESLQKTAIAITAIDAEALARSGVSQAEDLNRIVPGLGIAQGGSSTQVYVRGVGNYGTNALADPAVTFNMDNVYIGRFSGITGNFFDVSRVEVLKGPQGTLYGRNATGGAVNIVTNKPVHDFAAGVGIEGGNYSLARSSGFVNVPLGETMALRFAGQYTSRDGYQTEGTAYDDDQSYAGRLHFLYDPSDDISLLLTAGYLHLDGNGPAQIPVTSTGYVNPDDPWESLSTTAPVALLGAVSPFAPPDLVINGVTRDDGFLDISVKSFTAQIDGKVGAAARLTFIGNHMETRNKSKSYGPGFLFWQDDDARQDSMELRLGGESEALRWVTGLYYYKEQQSSKYWVDQGFLFNQTGDDLSALDDKTMAIFGETTFSITSRARLTAGVRLTNEQKTQDGQIFNRQGAAPSSACNLLTGAPPVFIDTISAAIPQAAVNGNGVAYPFPFCRDVQSGSLTWNDLSWKVGADFDVSDSSMAYVTISRGFKAGGFFAAGDHAEIGNTFEPEKLTAYAIGSKNQFLGNRMRLNAEAFYWDYKDHQESYLSGLYPSTGSAVFGFVTQPADAEIYGLDVEFDALVTDADRIGVKAQYLHAEYTDAAFIVARPNTAPPISVCSSTQDPVNPTRYTLDCTGQQMPRSPDFSVTADYSHAFTFGGGARLTPGVRVQYSSDYWSAVDYNPLQKQDSYTMYGADISYEAADRKWSVTAYGSNLGNEDVYTNSFMYPATNVAMNALRAPRTYGARFQINF